MAPLGRRPDDVQVMEAHRVLRLLEMFDAAGVLCWVDGWGVDALVGRQTREQGDLDLVVEAQGMSSAMRILTVNGYAVVRDWLPTAIAVCG